MVANSLHLVHAVKDKTSNGMRLNSRSLCGGLQAGGLQAGRNNVWKVPPFAQELRRRALTRSNRHLSWYTRQQSDLRPVVHK